MSAVAWKEWALLAGVATSPVAGVPGGLGAGPAVVPLVELPEGAAADDHITVKRIEFHQAAPDGAAYSNLPLAPGVLSGVGESGVASRL